MKQTLKSSKRRTKESTYRDDDVLDGLVVLASLHGFDVVDNSHASDHFAEDNMFPIQMGSLNGGDEKLRPVRIRAGVGHAQ